MRLWICIVIRKDKTLFSKALVSVHYTDVVAKSNRIKDLLSESVNGANDSIVGAKFSEAEDTVRHIITHCIKQETLKKSISDLDICIEIVNSQFGGKISVETIEQINKNIISHDTYFIIRWI